MSHQTEIGSLSIFCLYIPQKTEVSTKNVLRIFEAHIWKTCKNVESGIKNPQFLQKRVHLHYQRVVKIVATCKKGEWPKQFLMGFFTKVKYLFYGNFT